MRHDQGRTIVHVLRAPMGGVMRHVRDLALTQSASGHQVGVICDAPGTPGYWEDTIESLGHELPLGVHRTAMSRQVGPGDIATARRVLATLKTLEPDIVHGHGAKGGVYARAVGAMANRRRAARLYSPHGGSLHYDPASGAGKLYFTVERLLERACEGIVFVAEYERATYAGKIGPPRCPTHAVFNGLGPEEFEPVITDDDAVDFLFIGEMRVLKGPDLFVDAIARLRAQGQGTVRAVMVGDGADRRAIAEQIERAGLTDAIAMLAPMPARAAFACARTMVMPSRAEAMPYIVLEALGAGRPLIASAVGGIPEIMGPASPALITPDADALTAAMAAALNDPDALSAAMPAADDLKSRFSLSQMADGVMAAYEDALALARKGGQASASSSVS